MTVWPSNKVDCYYVQPSLIREVTDMSLLYFSCSAVDQKRADFQGKLTIFLFENTSFVSLN